MDFAYLTRAALAASTLLVAAPAFAQSASGNPATEDGTGRVIVLGALSFLDIDELDFGTLIVPSAGSGTASIDAITGATTYSGLDYVTSSATQRGRFIGSGTANQTVYVTTTLPTALELSPGGPSVPVSLNLDRAPDLSGNYVYTVDPVSLTYEVGVGGTVTVPTGTVVGNYSATFTVTATYQ
jgi:hypothetical protein